jgi:REP element-mobilizing transposase RayT
MSRPWRIQFPGAAYHVSARGNNRQTIFRDRPDREVFLELLSRAAERFDLRLFAFCLMTNHYHLFLQTPQPNLAASLHWLNATYCARFNRRHRRSGHLFQGRYHAVLVAKEAHWLHLSLYLHLNPVRANLVDDPADYEWSSFREYTRAKSRFAWLTPQVILAEYGNSPAESRRRYRRVCLALTNRPANFGEELRNALTLAGKEKLQEWAAKYPPAGQAETVPAFRRADRDEVNLPFQLRRVAEAFGRSVEEPGRGRGGGLARQAAYYHLVEHCGVSVKETARCLGVSASAVSQGLIRFRRKLPSDRRLRGQIQTLGSGPDN